MCCFSSPFANLDNFHSQYVLYDFREPINDAKIRRNWMTRLIALKGNLTTTGGRVLDGDATMLDDGQPLARHMGLASCPRRGQNGRIYD